MKRFLVAVDLQKDFVDGALGSPEAVAMIPAAAKKIRGFDGEIFVTLDTHFENYMETAEGKKLPVPHCIKGTPGWELDRKIKKALEKKSYVAVEKNTFGSVRMPSLLIDATRSLFTSGHPALPIALLAAITSRKPVDTSKAGSARISR